MKSVAAFLFLGLFLANGNILLGQTESVDAHVTVLSSPDAPGVLTKERVASCLQQLLWQWKLNNKELPNILVYHVSKKTAAIAQIHDVVAVRKNAQISEEDSYFEIWLVGEPNVRVTVLALQNLLEAHFALSVDDNERRQAMIRVVRLQEATLDVAEGK